MPEEGPYEIMPYKEIVKLKKELEELQKKSGEAPSRELLKSVDCLTRNMDSMLNLFKSAADEMKLEDTAPAEVDLGPVLDKLEELSGKLDDMAGKVEETLAENKTIAEGLVAVSDSINEKISDLSDEVDSLKEKGPTKPQGLGGPLPPPITPAGPIPPGMPGPGGIEGTISAAGHAPSRLPQGPLPGGPGAPPGMPPLPGGPGPFPPGMPPLPGRPGPFPPGMPPLPGAPGAPPPKKKGIVFSFGKK